MNNSLQKHFLDHRGSRSKRPGTISRKLFRRTSNIWIGGTAYPPRPCYARGRQGTDGKQTKGGADTAGCGAAGSRLHRDGSDDLHRASPQRARDRLSACGGGRQGRAERLPGARDPLPKGAVMATEGGKRVFARHPSMRFWPRSTADFRSRQGVRARFSASLPKPRPTTGSISSRPSPRFSNAHGS